MDTSRAYRLLNPIENVNRAFRFNDKFSKLTLSSKKKKSVDKLQKEIDNASIAETEKNKTDNKKIDNMQLFLTDDEDDSPAPAVKSKPNKILETPSDENSTKNGKDQDAKLSQFSQILQISILTSDDSANSSRILVEPKCGKYAPSASTSDGSKSLFSTGSMDPSDDFNNIARNDGNAAVINKISSQMESLGLADNEKKLVMNDTCEDIRLHIQDSEDESAEEIISAPKFRRSDLRSEKSFIEDIASTEKNNMLVVTISSTESNEDTYNEEDSYANEEEIDETIESEVVVISDSEEDEIQHDNNTDRNKEISQNDEISDNDEAYYPVSSTENNLNLLNKSLATKLDNFFNNIPPLITPDEVVAPVKNFNVSDNSQSNVCISETTIDSVECLKINFDKDEHNQEVLPTTESNTIKTPVIPEVVKCQPTIVNRESSSNLEYQGSSYIEKINISAKIKINIQISTLNSSIDSNDTSMHSSPPEEQKKTKQTYKTSVKKNIRISHSSSDTPKSKKIQTPISSTKKSSNNPESKSKSTSKGTVTNIKCNDDGKNSTTPKSKPTSTATISAKINKKTMNKDSASINVSTPKSSNKKIFPKAEITLAAPKCTTKGVDSANKSINKYSSPKNSNKKSKQSMVKTKGEENSTDRMNSLNESVIEENIDEHMKGLLSEIYGDDVCRSVLGSIKPPKTSLSSYNCTLLDPEFSIFHKDIRCDLESTRLIPLELRKSAQNLNPVTATKEIIRNTPTKLSEVEAKPRTRRAKPTLLKICDSDTSSEEGNNNKNASDEDFEDSGSSWSCKESSDDSDIVKTPVARTVKKQSVKEKTNKKETLLDVDGLPKKFLNILDSCEFKKKPVIPATPVEDKVSIIPAFSTDTKTKRRLFTPRQLIDDINDLIPNEDKSIANKENEETNLNDDTIRMRMPIPKFLLPPVNKKLESIKRMDIPSGSDKKNDKKIDKKDESPKSQEKVIKPKTPRNKKKLPEPEVGSPKSYSFLQSFDVTLAKELCHPMALYYRDTYKTTKEELTQKLYSLYNEKVFNNELNIPITWNKKLLNTAGRCSNSKKNNVRLCRVELSDKVLTSPDRLRCTLIHELCHASTWIFDGENGHGPTWKAWAAKANKIFPELPKISVCHQYNIEYKYTYQCTKCSAKYNAHSRSKKVENIRCSFCHGSIEIFINKKGKDGNIVSTPTRKATGFAKFVSEQYKTFKRPDLKHADVMKLLSTEFASLSVDQKKKY